VHEPGQLIRPSVLVTLPPLPLSRTLTTSRPAGAAGGGGVEAGSTSTPLAPGVTCPPAEAVVEAVGDGEAELESPAGETSKGPWSSLRKVR
jgi:hypothetical protein